MADNETIADIRKETEARFRELVEAWMKRRSTFQTTVGAMQAFNNVFDRLEAAHKREAGDAAKLREALAPFPSLCDWLVVNASKLGISDMVAKLRERVDKARAALAAPPRNCDKVKTSWDVLKEWHEGLDTANDIVRMLDWLLAPATEKEGGNDGNE